MDLGYKFPRIRLFVLNIDSEWKKMICDGENDYLFGDGTFGDKAVTRINWGNEISMVFS